MSEPPNSDDNDPTSIPPPDAELLAELRAAIGREALPDDLLGICRQLLDVEGLDGQLTAFLIEQSTTLESVRSGAGDEPMVFQPDGSDLIIEALPTPGGMELTVFPIPMAVEVERPSGIDRVLTADGFGGFSSAGMDPGPVRLRVVTADHAVVVTEWFVL